MSTTIADSPARTRHPVRAIVIGLGIVAVLLIAILATRDSPPGELANTSLLGHSAPAVSGENIVNQQSVSLARLRGQFVVVDFFASWCGPCQTEAPQIEKILFDHRSSPRVAVLGVVFNDSVNNARAFLMNTGATWPAVTDPQGKIAFAYSVDDPPQSFVVGPDGKVIASIDGAITAAMMNRILSHCVGARNKIHACSIE